MILQKQEKGEEALASDVREKSRKEEKRGREERGEEGISIEVHIAYHVCKRVVQWLVLNDKFAERYKGEKEEALEFLSCVSLVYKADGTARIE